MTSEQRHEQRYQRRKAARVKAREARCALADNYDHVFHYRGLYNAYRLCRRTVAWKASVQRYISMAPVNVFKTWRLLREDKYKPPVFCEFDLYERGKARHIKSTKIDDRVVQRAVSDGALVPVLGRSFIYDNGASMKDKGYTFAVNRMVCHLRRYTHKHGTEGYILVGDVKSFFDSIPHEEVDRLLREAFTDQRLLRLIGKLVYQCDPDAEPGKGKGLGLGSQVNQILAPAVLNRMDHYIKETLRAEHYIRYNDDFFLIHESREFLEACVDVISDLLERVGLKLNRLKTHITKLRHGFRFLKMRVFLTDTGRIVRTMARSSITRERKKIKKLFLKIKAGVLSTHQLYESFQSWNAHAKKFDSFRTRCSMERLFAQLYIGGMQHEMVQAA